MFDVMIIGDGAAGLSALLSLGRACLRCAIFGAPSATSSASQIANLENYPGVPTATGQSFLAALKEQAFSFAKDAAFFNEQVVALDKIATKTDTPHFRVTTTSGAVHLGRAVILATGASPRKLKIPGEEEFFAKGVSYCAQCDGVYFLKKDVCVVGGGDSALSEALYLSNIAKSVTIIYRRAAFFRAQKVLVERVVATKNIAVKFDTIVAAINGTNKVESLALESTSAGQKEDFRTDGVFIFAGLIPNNFLAENLLADDTGFILTDDECATDVAGFFVAGDVRHKGLRQIITATSDGAIAAHSATIFLQSTGGQAK